jgi:hypothetical protein
MAKQRLDGLTVLNATGNVLFRVTSRVSGEKKLPTTTFVDTFWSPTEIGYGTAAHVIHEGFVRFILEKLVGFGTDRATPLTGIPVRWNT